MPRKTLQLFYQMAVGGEPLYLYPSIAKSTTMYVRAIRFIAMNDNSGSGDSVDEIAGYVTTVLVSECHKISAQRVANDVALIRVREGLLVSPLSEVTR